MLFDDEKLSDGLCGGLVLPPIHMQVAGLRMSGQLGQGLGRSCFRMQICTVT